MKNISEIAVNNRISVFVLVFMIVAAGFWSYSTLPRENDPDVKIPYVFVSTSYRGVAPKDIETSITIPIEKKLKGLKNVETIKSNSSEGLSSITVEFTTGTDVDLAKQWVKDKVDEAKRELPTDLEDDPAVFEINLSEQPILTLAVTGKSGMRELKEIAEDIKEDIESIKGVLEVELVGGHQREIHIEVDPDKLAVYKIPFAALYAVIHGENQNVSGGNIAMGDGRYQLRVPGEFKSITDFQNLIVTMINDSPVYLRDVAQIKDSYMDITDVSKLNFEESINLYIKKRSGENIIEIVDKVFLLLEKVRKTLPDGIQIAELMDRSDDIRFMIADLENNIITGIILVVAVLFFAMGVRNALLVGIAIPLSMLLSFTVLQVMGITLNMVTLFSLTLALGMLVDNAIVIVENIYRYTSQGVPKIRAAIRASSEVAVPVAASTATTVAAFFPLLYWSGIMGEFMKYLPITLITTLLSSLFVAIVINPVFCAVFSKEFQTNGMTEEEIEKNGEKPLQQSGIIIGTYEGILRGALKMRLGILCSAVMVLVLFIAMWMYTTGYNRAVEFFPSVDSSICYINIDAPEGMDIDSLERIANEIMTRIVSNKNVPERFRKKGGDAPTPDPAIQKKYAAFLKDERLENDPAVSDLQNIRYVYTKLTTQTGGAAAFSDGSLPNHLGIQFHKFEGRVESTKQTIERIRARLDGIAGAHVYITEMQEGPPTGAPINIEISGENFDVLGAIAQKIKQAVSQIPHVKDVEDNYVKGSPVIELVVDRKKAALFGLTSGDIGTVLKTAVNGWNISTFREGDDDYDVFIRAKDSYRKNTDILKKLFVTSPAGMIPLSDLAEIKYTVGMGAISRIDHERVVTVKAQVDAEKMPGAVAKGIAEKMLSNLELPAGYTLKFTGEDKFQQESQDFLSKAFLIALLLVFLVLVIQFNSVIDTGIIMFSVILSLGGIFLGLAAADIPFGVIMTGIGVISLAGVVVNNAIVLLDYTHQLLNKGYSLTEAVVQAARTRFRPVMLTAITTILGLLPMITGISYDFHKFEIITASDASQFWFSMAIAVAFGLTVATVLTLVVMPAVFHLVYDMKARLKKRVYRTYDEIDLLDSFIPEMSELKEDI